MSIKEWIEKRKIFVSLLVGGAFLIVVIGIFFAYRTEHSMIMCGNSKLFLNANALALPSGIVVNCTHSNNFYLCPVKVEKTITGYFLYNNLTMTGFPAIASSSISKQDWIKACNEAKGTINDQIPGFLLCVLDRPIKCAKVN